MSLVFSVPNHSNKMEGHIEDLSHTLKDGERVPWGNEFSECLCCKINYPLLIGCQLTNQRMLFRHKHSSGLQLLPKTGPEKLAVCRPWFSRHGHLARETTWKVPCHSLWWLLWGFQAVAWEEDLGLEICLNWGEGALNRGRQRSWRPQVRALEKPCRGCPSRMM